jgi:hypothetical protein
VTVDVEDASAFTLYGTVRTGEQVGVAVSRAQPGAAAPRRIGLRIV